MHGLAFVFHQQQSFCAIIENSISIYLIKKPVGPHLNIWNIVII